MAFTKRTYPDGRHTDAGVVQYKGLVNLGAAGAITSKVGLKGVTVTRTGVGEYTLQLVNGLNSGATTGVPAIIGIDVIPVDSAATVPAVKVRTVVPSTGTITIKYFDQANAAAESPNPSQLFINIDVKSTGV